MEAGEKPNFSRVALNASVRFFLGSFLAACHALDSRIRASRRSDSPKQAL
jgi:hypothetical protein